MGFNKELQNASVYDTSVYTRRESIFLKTFNINKGCHLFIVINVLSIAMGNQHIINATVVEKPNKNIFLEFSEVLFVVDCVVLISLRGIRDLLLLHIKI